VSHAEAAPEPWVCSTCGNTLDAACGLLTGRAGCRIDAEIVVARLEAAGETLLSMRLGSPMPAAVRSAMPEVVQSWESYGWSDEPSRPAIPDAVAISRMDISYQWLALIKAPVTRRVVAARSLVSPTTGRLIFPWRRLGAVIKAHHASVQLWHAQGIAAIVQKL